ncbi:MAG: hypothetical protein JNK12_21720 [Acidimicrobiales bacterium]|nr:hypothetical protein [Acidimicrobiales bacterium]
MGSLRRWWRRGGAERGATGVEYALIAALLLFASLGAIQALERNADDYYDDTSSRIGALPGTDGASPTGTSIPGGSSTSTTAAPTTTTTAAPTTTTTTAPPTTTTTAPPTTTTTAAPTTTTTTAAPRSYISGTSASSDTSGSGWRPAITVTIKNTSTGANVSGAVVTVRFTRSNGNVLGTTTCTTATNGQCLARISGVSDSITPVTATVTNVSSSPTWNGATASRSLPHP